MNSNINVEIITIGDEILIGQIVDTNSAWMGQQLNMHGFKIVQITSVQDNREHILQSLAEAEKRADIILITGGLGPTKDDITKTTLCEYFDCNLKLDNQILDDVKTIFANMGREMTDVQNAQAMIPSIAKAIRNHNGTAPGIWIETENKVFVSMPGVPYEMKGIMTSDVMPMLQAKFSTPAIVHKTILTQGIGESIIAEKIADWENNLPTHIKLAYLPSVGSVRLRISAFGKQDEILSREIEALTKTLMPLIENYVYGFDEDTLEQNIGNLLLNKNSKLAIAESCTGGYLSHLVSKVPGASNYFVGSIISYANNIKEEFLDVNNNDLNTVGAVSKEVVEQMATNVRIKFNCDYGIATSGIAGPTGGSDEKPVGFVWIAVCNKNKTYSQSYLMGSHRQRTIERTALTALMMLRKLLVE